MPDVFISYAREDQPFVRRLHSALTDHDLEVWVDWEDIPPTAEWMREVEAAIEGADSFLFVASPDSVASGICRREVEHAASHHKRLVPVVYRDVDTDLVPESVRAHNWIFCRDTDDFAATVETIATALRTDLDWVHRHTRLLLRAVEWDENGRDRSFLLRGRDLADGERWLGEAARHDSPKATDLQIDYLAASRQGATRGNRIRVGAISAGLVVAVVLAVVAFLQRNEARHQATVARARELVASSTASLPNDPELGLWFAMEAERTQSSVRADQLLRQGVDESRLRRTYTPPGGTAHPAYNVLAVSPDLRRLVAQSTGASKAVTIRELRTGRVVSRLAVRSPIFDPAFNATGSEVVTEGAATELWDTETGRRLASLPLGQRPSFSADGTRLAVAGLDAVGIYETDGTSVTTLPARISPAVLNHDGRLAVVWEDCNACEDPPVVWDVESRSPLFTLGGNARRAPTNVAAFSPTADVVATGDKSGVVRVFDLSNPSAPLAELHGHTNQVLSVAFSRDGKRVVSGSYDGTARVWDLRDGSSYSLRGHAPPVNQAAFDDEGARVATIHQDQTMRIWDTAVLRVTSAPAFGGGAQNGRLDDAGDRSLGIMYDGKVLVRDTATARIRLRLQTPKGRADAAISGDGRVVVAASADGREALVWDVATGDSRTALRGKGDIFHHPALDANGARVVTSGTRTARIWNARTGALEHTVSEQGVLDASFSPDGDTVVLVGKDGGSLWDASSGELVARLQGTGDEFRRPRFSPDGTLLATVTGAGHAVRVWDAHSGELRRAGFGTGSGPLASRIVAATAFSEDGRQLLTVYDFGELRVWDTASGQLLVEPPSQVFSRMNTVLDVAFSKDRTHVTQLNDNAALATYRCLLCASTDRLLAVGDRRVSESVKRNASSLSLQ